jgi:hypothetical protein
VRELAKDLGVSAERILTILSEIGEFVTSPSAFVEEPVVAKVYEQCGAAYTSQGPKPVPGWDKHGSGCRVGPPAPPRQTPSSQARRQHSAMKETDRWAAGLGQDASDAFAYQSWKLFGFSDVERDIWIAAGLRPGQVKTAAGLRDSGLQPSDLQKDVNGWTVLERVTHGEGARAVARLLRSAPEEQAALPSEADLSRALGSHDMAQRRVARTAHNS